MRLLVAVIVLASLLTACSSDKPKRLKSGDVTVDELRALVPTGALPAGFTREEPSPNGPPNAPPIPTPNGTHYEVLFRHGDGSIIAIGIFAEGQTSLGNPVSDMCRNWQSYSKTKDCPIKQETAPAVGQKAVAYSSEAGPNGQTMLTTIFLRSGLRVGVGAMSSGPGTQTRDAADSMIKTIDARIQVLVSKKLNQN